MCHMWSRCGISRTPQSSLSVSTAVLRFFVAQSLHVQARPGLVDATRWLGHGYHQDWDRPVARQNSGVAKAHKAQLFFWLRDATYEDACCRSRMLLASATHGGQTLVVLGSTAITLGAPPVRARLWDSIHPFLRFLSGPALIPRKGCAHGYQQHRIRHVGSKCTKN